MSTYELSPHLVARCECGKPTTHKREPYGCGPLPCSCCASKVDGDRRPTTAGAMLGPGEGVMAQLVCLSCANHCRECRPFRDSGALRERTGRPESHYTGRYDGASSRNGQDPRKRGQKDQQTRAISRDQNASQGESTSKPIRVTAARICHGPGCARPLASVLRAGSRYCSDLCRKRAQRAKAAA